jgi:hypothetical protein
MGSFKQNKTKTNKIPMYKKKLICANIMNRNYFFFTSHSLDPNIINSGLILKQFLTCTFFGTFMVTFYAATFTFMLT